jgi:hypothetical protein
LTGFKREKIVNVKTVCHAEVFLYRFESEGNKKQSGSQAEGEICADVHLFPATRNRRTQQQGI